MRNLIFLFVIAISFGCGSCSKEKTVCDTPEQSVPQNELTQLTSYLESKNITAEFDSRGFYYVIEAQGNENKPDACSQVQVNYDGKLTNGARFDSQQNIAFDLSGLITGWRMGIPLIGEGGKITLYLPPSLGYGSAASGSIPGSSILIFQIDLLSVSK